MNTMRGKNNPVNLVTMLIAAARGADVLVTRDKCVLILTEKGQQIAAEFGGDDGTEADKGRIIAMLGGMLLKGAVIFGQLPDGDVAQLTLNPEDTVEKMNEARNKDRALS